jgi:outer membrane immunogenic protein
MKRFLLIALAGLVLIPGSALAADMGAPVYKAAPPPPPPPVPIWTGCYVNAGVGYGMWKQDHYAETSDLVSISNPTSDGGNGWLGRFGGGCDYQFSTGTWGNWVVGVFGDYDWMSLKGTNTFDLSDSKTPFFLIEGPEKESGAWAVGGRIGYLITPNLLTYWDGGYAQARFDQVNFVNNDNEGPPIGTSTGVSLPATTYHGWFLGGGYEYALDFSWLPVHGLFWRTEYRYASYSSDNIGLVCGGGECGTAGPYGFSEHAQKQVQTVTSSLVWRFNWFGH